jgi:hypothetical protein
MIELLMSGNFQQGGDHGEQTSRVPYRIVDIFSQTICVFNTQGLAVYSETYLVGSEHTPRDFFATYTVVLVCSMYQVRKHLRILLD